MSMLFTIIFTLLMNSLFPRTSNNAPLCSYNVSSIQSRSCRTESLPSLLLPNGASRKTNVSVVDRSADRSGAMEGRSFSFNTL